MRLNTTIKKTTILSAIIFQVTVASAQLWTNPITGSNPGASNPYKAGETYFDGAVLVSGIGRGTGIIASNANDRYDAAGWDSPVMDTADYFYLTIENDPTNQWGFAVNDFTFSSQASGAGPMSFSVRSSWDNFASDLGPATSGGGSIMLNGIYTTGTVTFKIYAWGATSASETFGINNFSFGGAVPLSLIFENFKARNLNNDVSLSWKLAGESAGEKINVLHCMDGKNFTMLKEMGQTKTSFTHEKPMNGTHYYRLQSVSLDGKSNYSKTIAVSVGNDNKIVLYPNPARNQLYISTAANGNTVRSLTIYNSLGAVVSVFNNLKNNAADISTITNGIYIAETLLADGTVTQQTFTINK